MGQCFCPIILSRQRSEPFSKLGLFDLFSKDPRVPFGAPQHSHNLKHTAQHASPRSSLTLTQSPYRLWSEPITHMAIPKNLSPRMGSPPALGTTSPLSQEGRSALAVRRVSRYGTVLTLPVVGFIAFSKRMPRTYYHRESVAKFQAVQSGAESAGGKCNTRGSWRKWSRFTEAFSTRWCW